MQAQVTLFDGSKAIGITFTGKAVTAFAGLVLFVAFAQLAILQADVPVRQLFGLRWFTPKALADTFNPLWRSCRDRG